jgi:hypothetical protein
MRTKTPLQEKTPFAIDAKPMEGLLTARAGLAAFSRAFRSLGAPNLCDEHVRIKERGNGFTAGQQVESLVLLHAAGGDCMQDIEPLCKDGGVTKMLGYAAPGHRCVADFLEAFHDPEKVVQARAQAQRQASARPSKLEPFKEYLVQRIAQTEILVATRFHGVVLSLAAGRPALGICYHRKTGPEGRCRVCVVEAEGMRGLPVPVPELAAPKAAVASSPKPLTIPVTKTMPTLISACRTLCESSNCCRFRRSSSALGAPAGGA